MMDALSVVSLLALQAMSILLLPHNIPDSLKHLSTMVDDIWYYAGDRSTDVSGFFDPTLYLHPCFGLFIHRYFFCVSLRSTGTHGGRH